MPDRDRIDELVGQWSGERPDLDLDTMALVARLLHVSRLILEEIEGLAARYGVGRGEGDVLFALRRSGPPYRMTPSRLASVVLVTTGTMTSRIDRLEARGLVRRIPSAADRRSLDVQLTEEGVRRTDEAVTEHVGNEQAMLEGLGAREREQLDRLVRKLLAHLESRAAPG